MRLYLCDVCILMYIRAGVVFGERLRHYIKHNTIDTPRWLKLTRNIRNDKQVDTIYIYILQSERDTDDGGIYNNIEVYTYDNILLYIIVSTLYFLYIFSLSLTPSRAHRDVDQQWNNSCIGTYLYIIVCSGDHIYILYTFATAVTHII